MKFSIARYWREKHSYYRLKATKCLKCGKINYPPSKVCKYCGSRELEDTELFGPAKVLTWTVIYASPSGYEEYKPLIIAMVELLGTGVRILTRLTDVDPEEVREGMLVEPVLRRTSEDGEAGIIRYALLFRPLIKGASEIGSNK